MIGAYEVKMGTVCQYCGAALKQEQKYCNSCGKKINNEKKKCGRVHTIVKIIVLVFVFLLCAKYTPKIFQYQGNYNMIFRISQNDEKKDILKENIAACAYKTGINKYINEGKIINKDNIKLLSVYIDGGESTNGVVALKIMFNEKTIYWFYGMV